MQHHATSERELVSWTAPDADTRLAYVARIPARMCGYARRPPRRSPSRVVRNAHIGLVVVR
jgi:hypothetical protein